MKTLVSDFIQQQHLLQPDGIVLVALSGGADSVALLHVLKQLGYNLHAVHCNFHLRGEESYRDQQFVETLCAQLGIPFSVTHFNTIQYAEQNHISIEMAARDLRYEWFNAMLAKLNAQAIAVAHHQDDQAETVLLNLIRGTGLLGLTGMHPRNGNIVRPFLCVNRTRILQYLNELHQDYVTDSSNLKTDVLRNKIRLEVIPLLQTINPSIGKTLSDTADKLSQAYQIYQQGISTYPIDNDYLPVSILTNNPAATTLLHEWLKDTGATPAQYEEMIQHLNNHSGQCWYTPTHVILHDRDNFIRQSLDTQPLNIQLHITPVEAIEETGPNIAYVDADKVQLPFSIRTIKQGDRFVPFGMKGSRLVSDFLTDLKLNRLEKKIQQVVLSGNDIVWVIGKRADNRFRVDKNTHSILKLSYSLKK